MRRKKRFGVFTNQTVKKEACDWEYWKVCKGPWNVEDDYQTDETKDKIQYKGAYACKRLAHQHGFGSPTDGKKFIVFNKRFHRHKRRDSYHNTATRRISRKRQARIQLTETLEELSLCPRVQLKSNGNTESFQKN